jgi:glycerol kinase
MQDCILAIDQGTTGSTVMLFDTAGSVVGRGYREFTQYFPQPGWVEHGANEILEATLNALATCMESVATSVTITGIGITNQRETCLLWDRATGRPVHKAIVWQCRRTASRCAELAASGLETTIREKTGLVLDAYFSGTKLQWLLEFDPDIRARAERNELAFGTIDTWLLWHLTGGTVHATDVTNASRTMLFNLHRLNWDEELLHTLGIPACILPEVKPSGGLFGHTVAIGGLEAGIPILAMAGDQHAALFGQGCFAPGQAKNTYGTGCFMLMNTGTQAILSQNRLLTTLGWQLAGQAPVYALEGSVFMAGAVIQWLRDGLGLIQDAAESESLAAQVADNGGVVVVPAFVGLGAPYWDGFARAAILGLTRGATKAHIARASLEAIAYQSRDLLDAMVRDSGVTLAELKVDGGATANHLLMQFQADILGVPVVRDAMVEATAWGVAAMAGVMQGRWRLDDLAHLKQGVIRFTPAMRETERSRLYATWQKAINRTLGWEQSL